MIVHRSLMQIALRPHPASGRQSQHISCTPARRGRRE